LSGHPTYQEFGPQTSVLGCQHMRFHNRYAVRIATVALIGLVPFVGLGAYQDTSQDECARTAHLQIYSNAVFVEEAGDIVGYELVFQQRSRNSAKALLYIYEGVQIEDGISISGQISDRKLTMEGDWVRHLVEEPSKKEIVETHRVEVSGTLDSNRFQGTLKISGVATPVTLKRLGQIWRCRR
jgi:hypothetical protein